MKWSEAGKHSKFILAPAGDKEQCAWQFLSLDAYSEKRRSTSETTCAEFGDRQNLSSAISVRSTECLLGEEMIRDRFILICKAAIEADQAAGGTNCRVLEPYFQELLRLAERHGNNEELKECFVGIVQGEIDAPYETLAYCMRGLRYEEIAEASRNRLGDPPDPRWMNLHSQIMHALTDEVWEDANLWTQMA